MGDVQKKLQDLSGSYQSFQAGEVLQHDKPHGANGRTRAVDGRRRTPEARVAATGKHDSEKGAPSRAVRKQRVLRGVPSGV